MFAFRKFGQALIFAALFASSLAVARPECHELLAALQGIDAATARPNNVPATAADALAKASYDSKALLDFFGTTLKLQPLFDKKASAKGAETVGEHTLEVLKNLNKVLEELDVAAIDASAITPRLADLLRATMALHDIGKGLAVEKGELDKQHAYTLPLLEKALAAADFTKAEIALAKALVNNNLLGDLSRGAITGDQAHTKLLAIAKEAGIEPEAAFRLLSAVWMADAGAHANLRTLAFTESNGRLEPISHDVVALGARVGVGDLWKGPDALKFAKADKLVRELNRTAPGKALTVEDVFDVLTIEPGIHGRKGTFTSFHQEVSKLMTRLAQPENAATREKLKQYGLDFTGDALENPLLNYDATSAGMFKAPDKLKGALGTLAPKTILEKPEDFVVLYHGTTPEGAAAILKNGVDLGMGNGEFGRGFYLTSSPEQARDWVEGTKKQDAVLVRVVLRRSAVDAMREKGAVVDFAMPDARTPGTDTHNAFELFVDGNRMLRKQGKSSDGLFEGVDMVSGPSVSARSRGTFDQFKFGGTERSKELFKTTSADMRLDIVLPP